MSDSFLSLFGTPEQPNPPHRIVSVQEWERLKLHYARAAATTSAAHRRRDRQHENDDQASDEADSG